MASTSSGCGKRSKKPNLDSNCKKMKKKPKLSDVMCPICLDILMEPVTLPCNHELCKACFEETVQNVKLSCPLCQMRISNWMRKATKNNTLINKARWNEIKRLFPDKVNDRLTGAETTTVDEDEISFQLPKISSPGLIRKEYELQLQRHEMEMKEERERERKASEDYIEKLKKEEERILKTKEKCVHHDEKLAKELHKCLNNGTIHDETQDVERFLDQIDDGCECHPRNCSMKCQDDVSMYSKYIQNSSGKLKLIDDGNIIYPSLNMCNSSKKVTSDKENTPHKGKYDCLNRFVNSTPLRGNNLHKPLAENSYLNFNEPTCELFMKKDYTASTSSTSTCINSRDASSESEIVQADYLLAKKLQNKFDKEQRQIRENTLKRTYSFRTTSARRQKSSKKK